MIFRYINKSLYDSVSNYCLVKGILYILCFVLQEYQVRISHMRSIQAHDLFVV